MSASPQKRTNCTLSPRVRFVPKADLRAAAKSIRYSITPSARRSSDVGTGGWYNMTVGLLRLMASIIAGLLWDHPSHGAVFPRPPTRPMSDGKCQDTVFAVLADPATHGGGAVKRIDTHVASIFLAGQRAFKVKRAVRFPFLDFSTLDQRKSACEEELR